MLRILALDLEEFEKGLVVLQSADVTSKDEGASLYRDSKVGVLLAKLEVEVRKNL